MNKVDEAEGRSVIPHEEDMRIIDIKQKADGPRVPVRNGMFGGEKVKRQKYTLVQAVGGHWTSVTEEQSKLVLCEV